MRRSSPFLYKKYIIPTLVPDSIIQNNHIPSCRNCVHYKPSPYSYNFSSSLSKCNKFATKDIITDEIIYEYVQSCRNDENKCGKEAQFFEKDRFVRVKQFKHAVFTHYHLIVISVVTIYYLMK
jgi:hypothetical protein